MRQQSLAVNQSESRSTPTHSTLNERSSNTLDYQHNLAILEEDWTNQQQLSTPSSIASSLFDMCRCCGRQDCDNLEYFNRTVKKLESDTRLAAEIGQGLLHKHETYVNESNQQRTQLEKQLEECHLKINGLENCLEETENQKDEYFKEKNKWLWEFQKRQKILDETIADLEMANEKCHQLSIDLESKSSELEKLRVFKFMVRNCEIREENLTSKLEDTNQELALCRKNELVLESKIKKLKTRYELLYNSHEQLTRDVEDKILKDATIVTNAVNNHAAAAAVATDTFKLLSSSSNNNNDLIHLIKELSSANTKLKSDLLHCRDQLSEAKGEVTALMIDQDDIVGVHHLNNLQDDLNSTTTATKKKKKVKRAASFKEKRPPPPLPSDVTTIRSKTIPIPSQQPPSSPNISCSMPTSSHILGTSPSSINTFSSSAIVHHHYHYYVKNSKGERIQITDEMESNGGGGSSDLSSSSINSEILLDCCDTTEKNDLFTTAAMEQQQQQQHNNQREPKEELTTTTMTLSPSSSSILTITKDGSNTNNPYILLQEHVTQVLERLRGSDIRALNRRLKRAFDITELSSMSNSVIDNILMDVDTLETRFLWYNDNQEETCFFPMVDLLKDMLKELGILRTTMNDLQVEYVNKVQQSQIRVEEEIIQKRQLKKQQEVNNKTNPLNWLTNMFYNNHTENNNKKEVVVIRQQQSSITPKTQQQHDGGSLLTKTTTTDSSTLILSPSEVEETRSSNKDHAVTPLTVPIIRNTTQYTFLSSSYTPKTTTKRRQQHHHQQPPNTPIPQMISSYSSGTNRNYPIIRNKRSLKRMHTPSNVVNTTTNTNNTTSTTTNNFSSSWLGGK